MCACVDYVQAFVFTFIVCMIVGILASNCVLRILFGFDFSNMASMTLRLFCLSLSLLENLLSFSALPKVKLAGGIIIYPVITFYMCMSLTCTIEEMKDILYSIVFPFSSQGLFWQS